MIEDPSSPSDELSIKEEAPIHEEEEIDHQNGESNVGSEVMPPPPPSCRESKKKKCPENELDNPDLLFLRSLLPEMSKLTPAQKSHFKISILQHLNSLLYSSSSSVSCPPSEFYCSSASSYVQNMNAAHSNSSSIASTPHPSPSDGNVYENSDPNFINIPRQFS
ncbi:hypothetical protein ANN_22161 [Periplaneta americana]|uniref:BESS domain-containing protein n=1 Tax=Periplaneta americana TaxID=6978 RepID=A0ABQ8S7E5_PERAM|nr:hypothetical protein ANN_22161 [Periplaneta americana]